MKASEIIELAKETISIEIDAIQGLLENVDEKFAEIVELINASDGRLIISGIGKSAIIGNKIVATMNSTGTPAIFMHAADAIHGDLGMILSDDIVLIISKSGDTPEIKVLSSLVKGMGNQIIAMVGNNDSYLSKQADYVINTYVEKEACPNNLAPTSSTTAQLVMGDALAVTLLTSKGFSKNDFAKFHPGGSLGKQLFLKVSDLCVNNQKPKVLVTDSLDKIIIEISSKRLGATAVLDGDNLVGIITDGDLRRMMQNHVNINMLVSKDIMSINPRTIQKDYLAVDALKLMKQNNITQLLVLDGSKYFGVIHLHDILREGIL